jgi:hypothetical protein
LILLDARAVSTKTKADVHGPAYLANMAEPLAGVTLRVFRTLLHEPDYETVDDIRLHLTHGAVVGIEAIEAALEELMAAGYVEEFAHDQYRIAPRGHAVKRSLQGEPI